MPSESFNMPQRYLFDISEMDHGKPWLCWMCGHPRSDSPWPHAVEEITKEFADIPDAKRKLATIPDGAMQVYICRNCNINERFWRPERSSEFEAAAIRYSWMSEKHYLRLRKRLSNRAGRFFGKSQVNEMNGGSYEDFNFRLYAKASSLLELVDSIWNRNHMRFDEWHANSWTRAGEITEIAHQMVIDERYRFADTESKKQRLERFISLSLELTACSKVGRQPMFDLERKYASELIDANELVDEFFKGKEQFVNSAKYLRRRTWGDEDVPELGVAFDVLEKTFVDGEIDTESFVRKTLVLLLTVESK